MRNWPQIERDYQFDRKSNLQVGLDLLVNTKHSVHKEINELYSLERVNVF